MFPTVANALGVPADTFMMPWPKKPLGKAPGGKGKVSAKTGHAKGHATGRAHKSPGKAKKNSYGFD